MVHSTRSNKEYSIAEAIIKGLADDGGLFIFDEFKQVDLNKAIELDYAAFSKYLLEFFLGEEFTSKEISDIVDLSYSKINFNDEIIKLKEFDNYAYLELYHGPTAAFKDMALTMLPHLINASKKKLGINTKTHILVATSGDTGSATLSGFNNIDDIDVTVLYPNDLVSPLQEKQMLLFSKGSNKAIAYDGNFDDCQSLVKEILNDQTIINNTSSANSINIGRLIPQIIYYFKGYASLVIDQKIKMNEQINVVVPTGNFGNILAGYIAYLMGLPVNKFICASNKNDVLCDLINKGIYDKNREFKKTYAPSMDIIVSSNVERMFYLYYKDTKIVKEIFDDFKDFGKVKIEKKIFNKFLSYKANNSDILKMITEEYINHHYLIDPHTACAYCAYRKSKNNDYYTLILSTASPYKFEEAISNAGINLNFNDAPASLKAAIKINDSQNDIYNDKKVKEYLRKLCQK